MKPIFTLVSAKKSELFDPRRRGEAARRTVGLIALLLVASLLAGCGQRTSATRLPGAIPRDATVALPTGLPTGEPSPVSTRVMPLEVFTPEPTTLFTPTPTTIPDEVRGLVVEVISGDTVLVVMDGDPPGLTYEVRYIGVDAPPASPENPWGMVAYETNRKLTGMKVVRLVRDEQEYDEEGRLLRYVYVGDELLSIILTEQGLVRAAVNEPNTRFQAEILDAEARARAGNLGLWGSNPTPTRQGAASSGAVAPAQPAATATPTAAAIATSDSGPATGTPASATEESGEEPAE